MHATNFTSSPGVFDHMDHDWTNCLLLLLLLLLRPWSFRLNMNSSNISIVFMQNPTGQCRWPPTESWGLLRGFYLLKDSFSSVLTPSTCSRECCVLVIWRVRWRLPLYIWFCEIMLLWIGAFWTIDLIICGFIPSFRQRQSVLGKYICSFHCEHLEGHAPSWGSDKLMLSHLKTIQY